LHFVESQPLFGAGHDYRIWDASKGELSTGTIAVSDLLTMQPWSEQIDE